MSHKEEIFIAIHCHHIHTQTNAQRNISNTFILKTVKKHF